VASRRVLLPLLVVLVAAVAFGAVKNRVEPSNCSGCGDCFRVCPVGAVEMVDGKSVIDPDACIGCSQCLGVCTHDAIR